MVREQTPIGRLVKTELARLGMIQVQLARQMRRPVKTVNEVINGRAAMTPETALQLEGVLGISARELMHMEADYRLSRARERSIRNGDSPTRGNVERPNM